LLTASLSLSWMLITKKHLEKRLEKIRISIDFAITFVIFFKAISRIIAKYFKIIQKSFS